MEQTNEWKKELLEMLNNPRTGLRDSSNTNKTRYGILALFEQSLTRLKNKKDDQTRKLAAEYKQEIKDIHTRLDQQREDIIKLIKSNTQGTFTDDGGNDCWYIDKLVEAIESLSKKEGK